MSVEVLKDVLSTSLLTDPNETSRVLLGAMYDLADYGADDVRRECERQGADLTKKSLPDMSSAHATLMADLRGISDARNSDGRRYGYEILGNGKFSWTGYLDMSDDAQVPRHKDYAGPGPVESKKIAASSRFHLIDPTDPTDPTEPSDEPPPGSRDWFNIVDPHDDELPSDFNIHDADALAERMKEIERPSAEDETGIDLCTSEAALKAWDTIGRSTKVHVAFTVPQAISEIAAQNKWLNLTAPMAGGGGLRVGAAQHRGRQTMGQPSVRLRFRPTRFLAHRRGDEYLAPLLASRRRVATLKTLCVLRPEPPAGPGRPQESAWRSACRSHSI